MDKPNEPRRDGEHRGEQNELGFYNADEDATYNERGGTQGEEPGDELAEEITDKP